MFESIKNRNRDAFRVFRRKSIREPSPRQRKNIKKWHVKQNRRKVKNSTKVD